MAVNLVHTADIEAFFLAQAQDDAEIAQWLEMALTKSLRRRTESAVEITELPQDSPKWLQEKWPKGRPYHRFVPDDALIRQVGHIRDWLQAARAENAPFVQRLDAFGVPKKLHNLDLEAAHDAADKFFARLHHEAKDIVDEPGSTETLMTFPDGSRIVKLVTDKALLAEGHQMGNCLVRRTANGPMTYYSLRDAHNESLVTISANYSALGECRGPRNSDVPDACLDHIAAFLKAQNLRLPQGLHRDLPGLVEIDGKIVRVDSLPDARIERSDLDLADDPGITRLTETLVVRGNLTIKNLPRLEDAGKRLLVTGTLTIANCPKLTRLPEGKVGSKCRISEAPIEAFPAGLTALSIDIAKCPQLKTIEGKRGVYSLSIRDCPALTNVGDIVVVTLELFRCPGLGAVLPPSLRDSKKIRTDMAASETRKTFFSSGTRGVAAAVAGAFLLLVGARSPLGAWLEPLGALLLLWSAAWAASVLRRKTEKPQSRKGPFRRI